MPHTIQEYGTLLRNEFVFTTNIVLYKFAGAELPSRRSSVAPTSAFDKGDLLFTEHENPLTFVDFFIHFFVSVPVE